jgi:uncharacterized protein YbjT (DUF2867 family)
VLGDLKEPDSLIAACRGAEAVITTANSTARGGEDTVQTVDLQGNRHLIDAARAAGMKQFIFVSVLTADPHSPVPFLQAKGQTEDYLRESSLPYTILAPNGYMEVMVAGVVGIPALMGQPVTIVGGGRRKHSFISVGDVAAFILAAIGNPAAIIRNCCLADRNLYRFGMPWRSTSVCLATRFPSEVWPPASQCQASHRWLPTY